MSLGLWHIISKVCFVLKTKKPDNWDQSLGPRLVLIIIKRPINNPRTDSQVIHSVVVVESAVVVASSTTDTSTI